MARVFVAGGTGYMGRELIARLLGRGHTVRALVRAGSEGKLPAGCEVVLGNALEPGYGSSVAPAGTFVHLVGVPHPSPAKAAQFRAVDLPACRAAIAAACLAGVRHFVYVSVAQPAPVMRAYVEVRAECERLLGESGLNATILRPWYVLGPGHRWPSVLAPVYWLFERIPPARASARRLGLVTLEQMAETLVAAVENPGYGTRIVAVPEIRSGLRPAARRQTA